MHSSTLPPPESRITHPDNLVTWVRSYLAKEVEEAPAACLRGEVAVVGALHALLVVAEGAVDLLHQEVVGVVAGPWIQGVGAVGVAHEVCHLEVGVVAMEVPLLLQPKISFVHSILVSNGRCAGHDL